MQPARATTPYADKPRGRCDSQAGLTPTLPLRAKVGEGEEGGGRGLPGGKGGNPGQPASGPPAISAQRGPRLAALTSGQDLYRRGVVVVEVDVVVEEGGVNQGEEEEVVKRRGRDNM